MTTRKELLSPADKKAGEITLAIVRHVLGNTLDAIDGGMTTDQVREAFKILPQANQKTERATK
jgi:hypothetical protein